MSLDITIKERKEFRYPDCGRLVTTQDIAQKERYYDTVSQYKNY